MQYVQESLSSGEKIIKISEYHWMYLVSSIIWAFMFLCVAGGIIFLSIIYHYYDFIKVPPWDIPKAAAALAPGDYFNAFRHINIIIRAGAFIMILMGVLQIASAMLVRVTTEIAVTNRRILLKRGLVSRRIEEMRTEYVEGADVIQTIAGRIFDYGQVKVYGTGTESIFFPRYTTDPVGFRRAIQSARGVPVQTTSASGIDVTNAPQHPAVLSDDAAHMSQSQAQ